MVLADATLMLLLIRPGAAVPGDAEGVPADQAKERIDYLVQTLENEHIKILIPTPVFSEILVRSKPGATEIIEKLNKYAVFELAPFDTLAAIELAEMARAELGRKRPDSTATYAKLKFDRQIVAIAKVRRVSAIYSDDRDVHALAKRAGINAVRIRDLPLPPPKAASGAVIGQGELALPPPTQPAP